MGLLGLSEHTPKGLWSRKSEYEYVNMTLTTLGYVNDFLQMSQNGFSLMCVLMWMSKSLPCLNDIFQVTFCMP